jgi:predicted fused transcriptional regulator/phosphomethylpyrimidine kinase
MALVGGPIPAKLERTKATKELSTAVGFAEKASSSQAVVPEVRSSTAEAAGQISGGGR